ncbi:MAG: outer membrane protein OmpA-like peptidoglycan-associated protein [Polaribacter sp.]|jgi:outer membrane protein OmpA-like peptidoglycan-associated protein/Tol biopolymer transport system component
MNLINHLLIVFFLSLLWCNHTTGQNLRLEYLNEGINTATYDEIAPCISPDGLVLYFTRMRSEHFERTLIEEGRDLSHTLPPEQYLARLREIFTDISGQQVYDPVNSFYNQDIFVANTAKKDFDVITHPSSPLNNALPNSISAIVPYTNEVIVVNQFSARGGMQKGFSTSHLSTEGEWSFPKPIAINNYHNSGPDVNLSISEDGQVMILSLERKDAVGKSDLYACFKLKSGSWSAPKNLGRGVNTPYREATPHLSKDKTKLFFSSDRGDRQGNSNIYMQTRIGKSWEKWTAPRKFISPINSNSSDSHPYFCSTSGHLYFCSNRNKNWDIFRVQIDSPKSEALNIRGLIFNKETMKPIEDAQVLCEEKGNNPSIVQGGREGNFKMTLAWATKATITASKEGFESDAVVVVTGPAMKTNYVKEIKFYLEPIKGEKKEEVLTKKIEIIKGEPELGKKIDLRPIYFMQSKAVVRKDSYKEIDRLAYYLKQHPDIYIQVSGHTDNQGDKAALLKLSKDRAKAIKDYLVYKQYINPLRIKTVGIGCDQSINDNSSNRLRKKNRRVEVEVISLGD